MKYVVPLIIFLLLFIIILDVVTIRYLDKTSENLNETLSIVEGNIKKGDWEKAKQYIEKVEKQWKKIDKKWALIIEHREIDEIEMNMEKLKSYIETKNKDLSMAQLKTVKMLLKYIPQNEKPTLENIF
ncbi:MAG TPA: DUF4363 family protein [Clostridia bacterium]|nr:DUF4363 family protein [Clostridia bacterium]